MILPVCVLGEEGDGWSGFFRMFQMVFIPAHATLLFVIAGFGQLVQNEMMLKIQPTNCHSCLQETAGKKGKGTQQAADKKPASVHIQEIRALQIGYGYSKRSTEYLMKSDTFLENMHTECSMK